MPLPIQLSHFYTVDPFVTLFSTIALYRIIRGKFGIGLGVIIGLAVGAKVSSILLIPLVGVMYTLAFFRIPKGQHAKQHRLLLCLDAVYCALGFALTLRVVYPYLFQGFSLNAKVLSNWKELTSYDGPNTYFPPGIS